MAAPRFELFVKADSKGTGIGDCPFCLKALMFSKLKTPDSKCAKITLIDLLNKPADFLKLNPAGTTPVLVDHENRKVISDSGEIITYLDSVFPTVDLQVNYEGPAMAATDAIFSKLVALLKNSDQSKSSDLRGALTAELQKLNNFLTSPGHKGRYLLGDNLSALDCNIVPKLKILQAAGGYYRNYQIPSDFTAVHEYIKQAFTCPCFSDVCPEDTEFVHGWKRHGITPDPK